MARFYLGILYEVQALKKRAEPSSPSINPGVVQDISNRLGPFFSCPVRDHQSKYEEFEIKGSFTIGRHHSCSLKLKCEYVSNYHAVILFKENKASPETYYCSILDGRPGISKSTNGTWINDRRIRDETVLQAGDLITLGSPYPQLIFVCEDGGVTQETESHEYETAIK